MGFGGCGILFLLSCSGGRKRKATVRITKSVAVAVAASVPGGLSPNSEAPRTGDSNCRRRVGARVGAKRGQTLPWAGRTPNAVFPVRTVARASSRRAGNATNRCSRGWGAVRVTAPCPTRSSQSSPTKQAGSVTVLVPVPGRR